MVSRGRVPEFSLIWAQVGVVLVILMASTAAYWLSILSFPYQIDFGEGPILDLARTVARGELPYKAIDSRPWNFSVYTPLYIVASGLLIDLVPSNPWLGGRLLNVISSLLLGGLLAIYLRERGVRSRGLWLAVPALWFASPFVAVWSVLFRVDLFSLLWSIVGFLLVDRAWRDDNPRLLALAATAMVLGVFSKQSLIAAPVAAALFLLAGRPRWLGWLVIPGLVGGAAGGLVLWIAAGDAAIANLNVPSTHSFLLDRLFSYQLLFWMLMVPLTLVASRGLKLREGGRGRLLTLYLLVSLPVTLAVAKQGSELNYFLESLWLLLAVAGVELEGRATRWPALPAGTLLAQSLLFALATSVLVVPMSAQEQLEMRQEADDAIRVVLDRLPPDALIYSEHMGVIAQGGRVLELDPLLYSQLAAEGYWDETPLVRSLAAGEAALLIQSRDAPVNPGRHFVWTAAMHDAAEIGYQIGWPAGEWRVRRPRPIPLGARREVGGGISLRGWLLVRCDEAACTPSGQANTSRAQERVVVHLLLESEQEQREPLTVTVALIDTEGRPITSADSPLRGGFNAHWPGGTVLRHEQAVTVPSAAGSRTLSLHLSVMRDARTLGSTTVELPDAQSTRR